MTIVSYYGGKQRLASKIAKLLPPHTVYGEPFAGGLAVMFAKGLPIVTRDDSYREAINDTNRALITLYRVCQDRAGRRELLIRLRYTPFAKEEYRRAVAIYNDPEGHSDLDVAWATFVNLTMSFANKASSGWGFSMLGGNIVTTYDNRKVRLAKTLARFSGVSIDCQDALTFIDTWDSPHTCFYCDPPYPDTTQGHYSGYSQEDFQRLVDKLSTCQASFVLSCYANQAVPEEWARVEFSASVSAANGRQRVSGQAKLRSTEVVWVMDRSHAVRADIQPRLWTPSIGPYPIGRLKGNQAALPLSP